MQLTLQDLLDNRQIQAAEPGLGLNSAITKERKPNEHDQQQTRRSGFMGAVPLPWDALHEFGRMICLGYRGDFWGHAQRIRQSKGPPSRTVAFVRGSAVKTGTTFGLHDLAARIAEAIAGPPVANQCRPPLRSEKKLKS